MSRAATADPPARPSSSAAYILAFAALAAAAGLTILSSTSYARVKAYMDSLAADGDAESLSPHLFAGVVMWARIGAAMCLLVAAAVLRFRARIDRAFATRALEVFEYVQSSASRCARAMAAETAAHKAVLVAIVAFGLVWRVRALSHPISYDEAFTFLTYADRPWFVAWADYSYPNNHLFHTLLMHLSARLFGEALWALRLPALVAGALLVPLSYAVARQFAGRREGLLAATLVATAQVLVAFSVHARGYGILAVLVLLVLLCAHDIVTAQAAGAWPILTALGVLGFFTVPIFIYPFVSVLAWLAIARLRDPLNPALDRARLFRCIAWTAIGVAACYAPALATSGLRAAFEYGAGTLTPGEFVRGLGRSLGDMRLDLARGLPAAALFPLLAAALVGGARLWRTPSGGALIVPLVLWPAVAIVVQRVVPPARVWLYLVPIACVYAAAGLTAVTDVLGSRAGDAILAAGGVVLVAYAIASPPALVTEAGTSYEVHAQADLEQVAAYLQSTVSAGDAVVATIPLDYPLEYYLRIGGMRGAVLGRLPAHPRRLIVVANDSLNSPVQIVLARRSIRPGASQPQLLHAFIYSSVYEVRP